MVGEGIPLGKEVAEKDEQGPGQQRGGESWRPAWKWETGAAYIRNARHS